MEMSRKGELRSERGKGRMTTRAESSTEMLNRRHSVCRDLPWFNPALCTAAPVPLHCTSEHG